MLIFEEKLPSRNRAAIINKIREVSSALGIEPNWLMAVINFESAGTFSPSIQNPYSDATGLIQFMPSTATSLGTTVTELKAMDFIQQLDYVKKYYWPYRTRIKGFVDLYLATFFPIAMGKPSNWVLRASGISAEKIAQQNPAFDEGGFVTVGKIKRVILSKIPAQYLSYVAKNNLGLIGLVLFVGIGYGIYHFKIKDR